MDVTREGLSGCHVWDFKWCVRDTRTIIKGKEEEGGVISVEPITTIILPELQDLPETITPDSSASASTHGDSAGHHSTISKGSSLEGMPSEAGDEGEGASNPSMAPVEAGMSVFKAALRHEVADGVATIKGYKRLEEMLTPRDVDLKNQLLDYVKTKGLVDLKALVTSEQLAVFGFVDMANQYTEAYLRGNVNELKARITAEQGLARNGRLILMNGYLWHHLVARHRGSEGMQNFVPSVNRQRAKGHIQQHGGHAAMLKLMDAFSYAVALFECEQRAHEQNRELKESCKQLTSEKASLEDEVSRLQSSEMANRAASTKSRADGLAYKVNELKEELEKAQAERDSGIQTTKDEASRAENHAKRVKANKNKALYELNSMEERVAEANWNVARAEASLERVKKSHRRSICIAQAQGAEWLVGANMLQDVVAIAFANTTTEIYNEIHGKLLRHRADFLIDELAFFEGEEMDEQGKSLAPLANATGLSSFDAWVAEPFEVEAEPSSIPPSSQPATAPALPSPARSAPTQLSPTRAFVALANASIPVDLTND
ncbi:hypothetical protein SLEP1_g48434 [Rubroshorea leprosula]|uniref:Uncharacterized protein n=1 Tax=Rubroshorea leprosula TaxID=152421 RepID=A0AAV5LVP7_9ROSI|nr:hypothetical protein SLEP1_g48434 [Rubroshorea leprosula]